MDDFVLVEHVDGEDIIHKFGSRSMLLVRANAMKVAYTLWEYELSLDVYDISGIGITPDELLNLSPNGVRDALSGLEGEVL